LFGQPWSLLERFSKTELAEGFWAEHGGALDGAVSRVIRDTDLPFATPKQCVRSMIGLFRLFFAMEPLQSSANMQRDSFCYDGRCGIRDRERAAKTCECPT
jgi:hypothetical protein